MVSFAFEDYEAGWDPMDTLAQVRTALGEAPRRFSLRNRWTYLRIPRPRWSYKDDLRRFFSAVPDLLLSGQVTWGHVIQANELLFAPGDENCPGEIVFGCDAHAPMMPDELASVATRLFALKGTQPEEIRERRIADHLTNEYTRVFGLPVPPSLGTKRECRISTVFFERRHLPNGILSLSYLPILTSTRGDGVVMIVPSRYWPKVFVKLWEGADNR